MIEVFGAEAERFGFVTCGAKYKVGRKEGGRIRIVVIQEFGKEF